MNVNQKGVKGLIKAIEYFTDLGWYCFPAFDDHSPVDLIVMDTRGKTYRMQVKYREYSAQELKDGRKRYQLNLVSMVNGKRVPIDRSLIDGWAMYCKDDDKVVVIPVEYCTNIKSMMSVNPDTDYGELSGQVAVLAC